MNGAGFRWDDGLVGPAIRIAGLNHNPMRVLAVMERARDPSCGGTLPIAWGRGSASVRRRGTRSSPWL